VLLVGALVPPITTPTLCTGSSTASFCHSRVYQPGLFLLFLRHDGIRLLAAARYNPAPAWTSPRISDPGEALARENGWADETKLLVEARACGRRARTSSIEQLAQAGSISCMRIRSGSPADVCGGS